MVFIEIPFSAVVVLNKNHKFYRYRNIDFESLLNAFLYERILIVKILMNALSQKHYCSLK